MSLEIKNLSLSFEGRRILKDISMSVKDGESLALMGPNGSGKTTLLRCIMNYLRPEVGAVMVDAKPIHTMHDRELAQTFAVVPQSSQIDFSFTAYEMVMMGRLPHSGGLLSHETASDASEVRNAMKRTNTWQFANRSFQTLSGGERQRVIIARALAQRPKILLLDEPTVYLDITGQLEIMSLIKSLNDEGMTIVAVLHDINMASRYCKKVALLHDGRLEAHGKPEEVFTPENISHIYGVDVIVRKDPLTNAVSVVPKSAVSASSMHGTRVHVLCGGGSGGPIMNDLVDSGFSPSAGVVNALDSDFESASSLHIPMAMEVPFSQISDQAHSENLRMIDESMAVIVAEFPIGPGNMKNLEAAENALSKGKQVIILGAETISERDFVGGKAEKFIESLIAKGAKSVKERKDAVSMLRGRTIQ